jgi:uncharacterized protein (TIGR02996 family)
MGDGEAFLEAIRREPDDDGLRLIYADWLDEHGDAARAEFLRVQIELAAGVDAMRRVELRRRERALLEAHQANWLGPLHTELEYAEFLRGLPHRVGLSAETFLTRADEIFRLGLVTTVQLRDFLTLLPRVAWSPHIRHYRNLDLSLEAGRRTGLRSADLRFLTESPYLGDLQGLSLRGHQFGPAGTRLLSGSRSFPELRRLDLSSCGHGSGGLEALTEPTAFPHLTELAFDFNGLHAWGAGELIRAARWPELRWLSLAGNELTARVISEFLSTGLSWEGLVHLDLSHNLLLVRGLDLLASQSFRGLRVLLLARTGQGASLADRFRRMPPTALARLDLSGNHLGTLGAAQLAGAGGLANLADLDLSGNEIGNRGAEHLAAAPHFANLGSLRLTANGLGSVGLRALLESSHLSRLHTLELGGNRLGDEGARLLAASPRLGQLVRLVLRNNRIGDAGAKALAASPYLGRLYELDLSANELSQGMVRGLPAAGWRAGMELELSGNATP